MRNWLVLLLILLLCPSFRAQTQNPETIRIGAFLSLTGATASYGTSALNAIKLATEETNRAGGINGKQIDLVVEDDHSSTDEVPGIVTKLIKDAKFVTHRLKAKSAAIILDDSNDYAVVLAGFFAESLMKLGGRVVVKQFYRPGDADISGQLASIKAAKPEVIFAPGFYTTAPLVAR